MCRILLLGVAVIATGCGASTAVTSTASHPSVVERRLARMAWDQARSGGNRHPQSAVYVLTQRGGANQASSGGSSVATESVYLVEVIGPFPHYPINPPAGGPSSIHCTAISITLDRRTLRVLDDGCGKRFDISKLGTVHQLTQPTAP
jgi:hypothetical protein